VSNRRWPLDDGKEMMLLWPADVKNMYSVNVEKTNLPKWTEQWNRTVAK
jgi:hypothetical protein